MKLLHYLKRNISNLPGWRTNRKIVVFESDDWGSIRMPSLEVFNKLKSKIDLMSMDYGRYNLNDTLASKSDLEALFEVLYKTQDKNGNPTVFTALSVVANPDFNKIRESKFEHYFYEPFTETLKRYYPDDNVFSLWQEGYRNGVFIPQFHGREHLNVKAWLEALKAGDEDSILAFNEGFWGFLSKYFLKNKIEFQAAFQLSTEQDIHLHSEIIKDGLNLFEKIHGYRARYFVAPNGPINNKLNNVLIQNGIEFRSTSKIQIESIGNNKTRRVINWLGKKDKSGIVYITRNCFFEPNLEGKDWVDSCLNDINIAFSFSKPAIISSHRTNYIGALNPSNRDNSLRQLNTLLKRIISKWPDVEFLSTVQLGELIKKNNHL